MITFRGGVHPREDKEATEHRPVEVLPLPARVFIPMSQHTGAPSKPVVKKGDPVKTGTLIGEAAGRISVPTHASVSGKVVDVTEMAHPLLGRRVSTVIIDSDGTDTLDDSIGERPTADLTPKEIIDSVQAAGVVGMGGAAFPTSVKLSPPPDKPVDTLIINGCECEPFLTADHRLMLENPKDIIEGTEFIARALGVKNVIIAAEDNKPDALVAMAEPAARAGFHVRKLKTKYPQGAEKQLIKACLKREVPSGGLPMDVRTVVQNVGTAIAVRDAVKFRRPLFERVTTVTGPAIKEPKNLRVRVGTPVKNLIDACGGYKTEVGKLIIGGPMMGIAVPSDEVPVLKGTSGVLVLDPAATVFDEHDCIRCGRCITVCPMGLVPQRIANLIKRRKFDQAKVEHVLDCIECGCCAFACPAKIRLVHRFKYAKSELAAAAKKP